MLDFHISFGPANFFHSNEMYFLEVVMAFFPSQYRFGYLNFEYYDTQSIIYMKCVNELNLCVILPS